MDYTLYYIRDNLVGTHYFIYAFVLLFIMFSLIGYLFKQKYAKLAVKLDTSQTANQKEKQEMLKKENKLEKVKLVNKKEIDIKNNSQVNVNNIEIKKEEVKQPEIKPEKVIKDTSFPKIEVSPEVIAARKAQSKQVIPKEKVLTGKIPEIK